MNPYPPVNDFHLFTSLSHRSSLTFAFYCLDACAAEGGVCQNDKTLACVNGEYRMFSLSQSKLLCNNWSTEKCCVPTAGSVITNPPPVTPAVPANTPSK